MTIKIFGSGCPNCQTLENNAKKAVAELNLKNIQIEHICDLEKIIATGIMSTPAIAINEQIKVAGRIPTVAEIKEWLA